MRPVSFLIKPVSGACNMACEYCFYRTDSGHNRGVMTHETAEMLVRRVFEYADADVCFAFQGGEPTLAGVDFYRFFVSCVEKENRKSLPVYYSVQTNGLDHDPALCRFFAEKKFLVGISLDGPEILHDRYRKTSDGAGSYKSVIKGIEAYRAAGADVNILTVVTDELAKNTEAAWNALAELGLPCLQFILCLETRVAKNTGVLPLLKNTEIF